jgi:hypothetical protein
MAGFARPLQAWPLHLPAAAVIFLKGRRPCTEVVNCFTGSARGPGYDSGAGSLEAWQWRSQMTAIARPLRRVRESRLEADVLKTIALFCGVGLVVSLLLATNGLDMSPGFF